MKIGGKEINNWYIVGGAAALVGGYFFWKHYEGGSSSSSTSTGSANANAIDPVTGMPYSQDNSVDPITGLTYLAEAQQYGSVQAAEQMVTSGSAYYGQSGSYPVDSGYPSGYDGYQPGTASTATVYQSNAQWASAVQAGLVGIGYSPEDVASALGLFFAGHPLSASQANIVQVAEAEFGPPPQGNYSIIPSPPGPNPVTDASNPPKGLHVTHATSSSISVAWDAVSHATKYEVHTAQENGKVVSAETTTSLSHTVTGLHPGYKYKIEVWGDPAKSGSPHATVTASTSK